MTTLSDLKKMNDIESYFLAKKMVAGCFDKEKIYSLAGGKEDLIQLIATQLDLFKKGAEKLHGGNVETACFGIVRGRLRANWMGSAFREVEVVDRDEDEGGEGVEGVEMADQHEDEEAAGWSLDDIQWLTAVDKLLIRHDTLKIGSAHCQTQDIAEFFGCETRTIRYRRAALKKKLIEKFNLGNDFFERKQEFAY